MYRHLFFICPTDNLESVINNTFDHENFFYTSLGNSTMFKVAEVVQIKNVIIKHRIREITFVLSNSNPIISDAFKDQSFSQISGLKRFYHRIKTQKEQYDLLIKTKNEHELILSCHLRGKMLELDKGLKSLMVNHVKINGKIYNSKKKKFSDVYSDLVLLEHFNLN